MKPAVPDANDYDKHDGEEDLNGLELLDQPQDHEAEDLIQQYYNKSTPVWRSRRSNTTVL